MKVREEQTWKTDKIVIKDWVGKGMGHFEGKEPESLKIQARLTGWHHS